MLHHHRLLGELSTKLHVVFAVRLHGHADLSQSLLVRGDEGHRLCGLAGVRQCDDFTANPVIALHCLPGGRQKLAILLVGKQGFVFLEGFLYFCNVGSLHLFDFRLAIDIRGNDVLVDAQAQRHEGVAGFIKDPQARNHVHIGLVGAVVDLLEGNVLFEQRELHLVVVVADRKAMQFDH